MKKKNQDQYSQALQNLKDKKELLPLHKMDDPSRRKFIQSVGFFLGALGAPMMIRLETMSNLSRKIFGNSLAYAANTFASGPIDINFYLRAGFSNRWIVGYYGDDTSLATNATVPWATGVTSTATGDMPVILPPNAQALVPFAGGIQQVLCNNTTGHTAYFQHTQKSGMGELMAWRAATEDKAGGGTLLKSPFVFGDAVNSVAVQDLPSTLAEFAPMSFNSVAEAYGQFSPPTFVSPSGTTLSSSLRDQLLATIGSRFTDQIKKGVLQKNADLIVSNSEQALKILKTDYQAQLNPASTGNTSVMADLTAGLGSQGNLSVSGMNPAQAIFVLIKAALLGVTPMVGGLIGNTGDWHAFNSLPSGDGTGDTRHTTGGFLAQLAANVCTAASGGVHFLNPVTGNAQEVRIHFFSEFQRTLLLGNSNSDDGDGQVCGSLTIGSKATQTDYKSGCFGGANASGSEVGFNPSTGAHATSISWATPDTMLGHNLSLLKIDRSLFNLTSYTGFGGNLA